MYLLYINVTFHDIFTYLSYFKHLKILMHIFLNKFIYKIFDIIKRDNILMIYLLSLYLIVQKFSFNILQVTKT